HGGRPDVGPECVVVLRLRLLPQRQILILVQELVRDDILRAGVNDDVVGVIDDLLEITQGDVEHVPHGTGKRLEEPDVRHRHGELDVAHALAAHARQRDLHAAPVADYAAIADALVLAAMAFPVLDRAEDALAEEPILLRLERPVIDGLRLGDLTPGPPVALPLHLQALTLLGILGSADLLGRRDANLDEIERRAALLAHAAKINHVLLLSVAVAVHAVTVGGSELHPDAERLQLLHQYVERLRNAWLWKVLSLDDGFVYPAASVHIVRLDGENFLQRVRGAVRLQCPYLHFSEPLTAELGLARQRLLRDQRVRSDAPRVDLVIHQVRELEHVDLTHRYRAAELLARASVAQPHLAPGREAGEPHELRGRLVHVRFRLGPQHAGQRRQLQRLQRGGRLAISQLLQVAQRRTILSPLLLRERFILGQSGMPLDLGLDFLRLTRGQFPCGTREEVAHPVIQVARLLRHAPPRQVVQRGVTEIHVRLALLARRFEVGQERANVRHRGGRRLTLQRQSTGAPPDAGEFEQHADLTLIGALEHRRLRVEAQHAGHPAEVRLQNLAD